MAFIDESGYVEMGKTVPKSFAQGCTMDPAAHQAANQKLPWLLHGAFSFSLSSAASAFLQCCLLIATIEKLVELYCCRPIGPHWRRSRCQQSI